MLHGRKLPGWKACVLAAAMVLLATRAWGEDSATRRYYLDVRYGESNPATKAHDVAGLSLGVNLGRYLGFELAVDRFQLRLETTSLGRVGDLGVKGFTPQVRLRYPLLDDRLTPYVVGGMGVAVTDLNDAIEPVTWTGGNTSVRAVSTFGVGLEYFLRDNIAFGVEGKFFILGHGRFTVDDSETPVSLNTGTITFGFRLFYPELHPADESTHLARRFGWRLYGAIRVGGALQTEPHLFPGITTDPSDRVLGTNLSTLFGGAIGVEYGRYLGLEASFENYAVSLSADGRGTIGKYAVFPILMQGRLRYPLLTGRLEPYLLAGIGAEVAEPDKPNENAHGIPMSRSATLAGSVGAGVQYFVMKDIALGVEAKYIISGDHAQYAGAGDDGSGNTDALFLTLGLRVYLFDF